MPHASTSTLSTCDRTARALRPEQLRLERSDALERVGDRARLLEDLLLHEMAIRAELHQPAGSFDRDDGSLDLVAACIVDRERLAAHVGDVALFQIDDPMRDRQQRRGVGGEEMIVVAQTHDQRTACARTYDPARLARRDDGDRIRAGELGNRRAHGAKQIAAARAVPVRVHEMRDHLGVGLRAEFVAARLELVAQALEVLDDAVVHDRDLAIARVRMRVVFGRRTVRRPPRVRDAGRARRDASPPPGPRDRPRAQRSPAGRASVARHH